MRTPLKRTRLRLLLFAALYSIIFVINFSNNRDAQIIPIAHADAPAVNPGDNGSDGNSGVADCSDPNYAQQYWDFCFGSSAGDVPGNAGDGGDGGGGEEA